MATAELHRWARPIILEALSAADIEPEGVVLLAAHGVGDLETTYSYGWKGAGKGSNNWAADQSGRPPCALATSFEYVDTHPNPDGSSTTYRICFRRYADAVRGAAGLVRELFQRRPSVLRAAQESNLYGVSLALYETRYYEGFGKTPANRILNHYNRLFSCSKGAAVANGESPPQPWIPATEPWMHDLSPVHPTLRRGSRHHQEVKIWQRSVLNPWLEMDGGEGLVVDGMFGPLTEESTERLQRFWNLKADGIVGPVTWDAAEDWFDEAA